MNIIVKDVFVKITNVYSFYIDDKIFIEELWCLLQFIIFFKTKYYILIEFLNLLNKIITYDNQIEYIVRGTPAIACLFFCLQILQNHENNLNDLQKDCYCVIVKIIMNIMEKAENPDFFLVNLKANNDIQLFFKKFGFKNFLKISTLIIFLLL